MIKLNLGCGPYRAPAGWINVDHPASEFNSEITAEIYCLIEDLPFRDSSAERIYCGHVLEHIPLDKVPDTLMELDRVLTPDGILTIVGPDMDRIKAVDHEAWLDEAMRVDNDGPPGIHHRWVPTATNTLQLLEDAGFLAHETPVNALADSDWPVVAFTPWQFAIEARP